MKDRRDHSFDYIWTFTVCILGMIFGGLLVVTILWVCTPDIGKMYKLDGSLCKTCELYALTSCKKEIESARESCSGS